MVSPVSSQAVLPIHVSSPVVSPVKSDAVERTNLGNYHTVLPKMFAVHAACFLTQM